MTLWTERRPGNSRRSSCRFGWSSSGRLVVVEVVAVVAVVAEAAFCVLF